MGYRERMFTTMGPALQDIQRTEQKERDFFRATEVDRCTTVIQIAFIPELQRERSAAYSMCSLPSCNEI